MICLSWNVRGLGNSRAFAALSRLLKKHSPDFVFISETKVSGHKASSIKDSLQFGDGFIVDCVGMSGDLMLLWKKELLVSIQSFSVGHIDACIQMEDGFTWRFSGFYGDPIPSKRVCSWALLRRLRDVNLLPWVFRQATDNCDLMDLGSSGPFLTWNNRREGRDNVQERLDRFLADSAWRDKFYNANVEHLGFNSSDHRAILLRLNRVPSSRNFRGREIAFWFEPFWIKKEDIGGVVKLAWSSASPTNSVEDLKRKLNSCASKLLG
ncbi:hypothetical protein EZV62_014270 [Acer yangbiense]|uniref:Endonuclease/exonuclease/phosphatase domain-containing protein n=1 Tax=Acer yangbiense TaxID=1000413 RepID=A0A5C7HRM0_9ROSI|nr:hypothetical protein EZV62_014270 [Acer yangbiense]